METSKIIIVSIIAYILGIATAYIAYGVSSNVDVTKPYHYLSQIAEKTDSLKSVDVNQNGIIDHTDADLQEILSNGATADIDLTLNAQLTVNDLEVKNLAQIPSLTGSSLSYSSGTITLLHTETLNIDNTVTSETTQTNKLCLLDETANGYVCIDKWEDLLDILFASTP